MKPTLQLKTSQHLTLTPQLQESIRLLQLSTLELNQEIERLAQENPLLELDDSVGSGIEYLGVLEAEVEPLPGDLMEIPDEGSGKLLSDDSLDAKKEGEADWLGDDSASRGMRDDDDERDFPQQAAEPQSLREHLNSQLCLSQIPERDRKIVGLLIDSLDDDGYLVQDLEELVDLLPPELEIDIDDLHIARELLQHLDPPGVGARNLRECLVMQLQALPESSSAT